MSAAVGTGSVMGMGVPRSGLILCRDERLCRLLETELAYLGVVPRSAATLPEPLPAVGILLLDGDGFPLSDGMAITEACECPLLVFGREPVELSLPPERGLYLRRPFALPALEMAVRRLLAGEATPAAEMPSGVGHLAGALPSDAIPSGTVPADAFPAEVPLSEVPSSGAAPAAPSAGFERLAAPPSRPFAIPPMVAENGTVTVGTHTVTLTPAEWAIFEYLRARRGEAVPRGELAALLGGGGNSVDVYVCHLRTKIEKPLGRRMIVTVRGVGYRMET